MRQLASHTRLASILLALALSACGGDPRTGDQHNNEYVHYSGSLLVVDGIDYPRQHADFAPARGRVLLMPKDDQRAAAVTALGRYGLALAGISERGVLVATVPEGFEDQWAAALSNVARGLVATTDDANSPTAFVPTTDAPSDGTPPSDATPASAGTSVPDGEPPADVVRRLTYEMYAKLESDGGVPITLTATGASAIVHMQLADVQKESCKQLPQAKPGEYECGVLLKVRSCLGDCDPSGEEPLDDAKRIDIRWDASGKWVLG